MKYIFVDLDNTLINAEYQVGGAPKGSKVIKLDDGKYWARLRPGALGLLYHLRTAGPTYMLTAAAKDYALAWNKEFDLNFKPEDIYSREDSEKSVLDIGDKFKEKGKVFLIDDKQLPFEKTKIKVDFIKNLGEVKIIIVKPYYGHNNTDFTQDIIDSIYNQITSKH